MQQVVSTQETINHSAQNRLQVINKTNDNPDLWCHMASLGHNKLKLVTAQS